MQRYWPGRSSSSSVGGGSGGSPSLGPNTGTEANGLTVAMIKEKLQLLSMHALGKECKLEATDIPNLVRDLTEGILDQNPSVTLSLLNDLLFSRTKKSATAVLTGAQGMNRLKAENRQERCGKVFADGDLAYNCWTCQVDSTCVICQECFESSNHEGHEITFHRTAPGGCCDCGDAEAWAPSGFCTKHGPLNDEEAQHDPRESLPENLNEQSKLMISCVFEVIVKSLEEIFRSYGRCYHTQDDVTEDKVMEDAIASVNISEGSINVILNNDDVHSFSDVKDALVNIRPFVPMDRSVIDDKTKMIDAHGRAPVYTKAFSTPQALKSALKEARKIRKLLDVKQLLTCVSLNTQQIFERRTIAGLTWLTELTKVSQGLSLNIVDCFTTATGETKLVDCTIAESYMRKRNAQFHFWPVDDVVPGKQNVVQAIFNYDALMPKQFIKSMQALWLSLLTNVTFKHFLGSSFMRANARISSAFSNGLGTDNETSMMLAVQFLTVPSIVQSLEVSYEENGRDLVVEIFRTLKHFLWSSCERQQRLPSNSTQSEVRTNELSFKGSNINRSRYSSFVHSARYICRLIKQPLVNENRLKEFIALLRTCQRMNIQERFLGRYHVDYEEDTWINAFNLSLVMNTFTRFVSIQFGNDFVLATPLNELCENVRRVGMLCFESCFAWHTKEKVRALTMGNQLVKVEQVQFIHGEEKCFINIVDSGENGRALSHLLRYDTKTVTTKLGTFTLVKSSVGEGDPVSHHLPVQRFFSMFVTSMGIALERKVDGSDSSLETLLKRALADIDMNQFMEDVMRVFAANAQINAQLWRRNGYTMDNIVANYKGLCSYFMYQADVAFSQIVVSCTGPELFISALLDKFGLSNFFKCTVAEGDVEDGDKQSSQLQLADELLRLVAHVVTEIPSARQHAKALLRREIIHAIVQHETSACTFSMISGRVRAAKIPFSSSSSSSATASTNTEQGGDAMMVDDEDLDDDEHDDEEDEVMGDEDEDDFGGVPSVEIEKVLLEVATKNSLPNSTTFTYSLRPEIWDEVDPYYWNVQRQHEEVISEKLMKQNQDRKKECWPMTGKPPGPPVRILAPARNLVASEPVMNFLVQKVLYGVLAAGCTRIAHFPTPSTDMELGSPLVQTRKVASEERAYFAPRVSPGLTYSAIHLLTLFIHNLDSESTARTGLHPDFDHIITKRDEETGLSLLEIMVNLEGMYCKDNNVEKRMYMKWCNDMMSTWYPDDIALLRQALDIGAVKAMGKKKAKGAKKKKKDRAGEAQRLVMERMKAAQAKVLESFGGENAFDEGACLEENYCVLCHEHIEKLPYAFLGYARSSCWGYPQPIGPGERCPPGVLTGNRKPAGWWRDEKVEDSSSAGQGATSREGLLQRAYRRRQGRGNNANDANTTGAGAANNDNQAGGNGEAGTGARAGTHQGGGGGGNEMSRNHMDLDWAMSNIQQHHRLEEVDDESEDDILDDDLVEEELDDVHGIIVEEVHGMLANQTGAVGDDENPNVQTGEGAGNEQGDHQQPPQHTMADLTTRIRGIVGEMVFNQLISNLHSTPVSRKVESAAEVVPDNQRGVYVSFCSHAMHMQCLHKYIASLKQDRQNELSVLRGGIPDINNNELFCPMCKSLSNVIVPFVASEPPKSDIQGSEDVGGGLMAVDETQQVDQFKDTSTDDVDEDMDDRSSSKIDKRRRISSGDADEMARFITRKLEEQQVNPSRAIMEQIKEDIKHLSESIYKVEKSTIGNVDMSTQDSSAEQLMVSLWKSLSFSIAARECIHRPMCGVYSSYNGYRELMELIEPWKKQWHAFFRAAELSYKASRLVNHGKEEESRSSSSTPPRRSSSSSLNSPAAFGRSLLRSPFSLFLNTFRKSSSASSSSGAAAGSASSSSADSGASASASNGNDLVENGKNHDLFQMLTTGICSVSNGFGQALAPETTTNVVLHFDENIIKAAGTGKHVIAEKITGKEFETNRTLQLVEGDEIVTMTNQQIVVKHKLSTSGLLLNMEDPVTVLVGLLCSLPMNLYRSAARAVAVATLVQGIVKAPENVELCKSSIEGSRLILAQQWLEPLRQIVPSVTLHAVYQTLFAKLARFLRSALMLVNVAIGENEGSSHPDEQGEFNFNLDASYEEMDEVEVLWMHFLGLPPIDAIIQSENMMTIIHTWKQAYEENHTGRASVLEACCLERTRLGLISLPQNYEQLLAHVSKAAKCPTNGTPIRNPALCLRCGYVVCARSMCCKRNNVGAGTLHAYSCGGGSCAFLLVQQCVVILVHGKYAVDMSAPYVDSHGETDDFLRRGRPLTFHPQAYKNLQYICANNEIFSKVVGIMQRHENSRNWLNANAF